MQPKITVEMLRAKGACMSQVDKFAAEWPDGCPICIQSIDRCITLGINWSWAESLLSAQAWAEYERVRAQALAEYARVTAQAWAEYERVRAPAWAEYERVTAQALAEYERVRAPALAEYERVRAPALAEYQRVTAPALMTGLLKTLRRRAMQPEPNTDPKLVTEVTERIGVARTIVVDGIPGKSRVQAGPSECYDAWCKGGAA